MSESTSQLVYVIDPDFILHFAQILGVLLLSMSALLLMQVIFLRLSYRRRTRLRKKFIDRWRPVLMSMAYGDEVDLPTLKRREVEWLLIEWNRLLETIGGEAAKKLRNMFSRLELGSHIDRMLYSKSYSKLLLAVVFAGHVGYANAWNRLKVLLDHSSPLISILSARSMMSIDSASTNKVFLSYIEARPDWPIDRFVDMFRRKKDQHTSSEIIKSINLAHKRGNVNYLARLVPLLVLVDRAEAMEIKDRLFENPLDDKVVAELLKLVDSPKEKKYLNRYCWSDRWHVRLHVISAYGRIADVHDLPIFLEFMTDDQWWVRYRAVEALIDSRIVGAKYLTSLSRYHEDKYARDMISHVMAERGIV